MTAAGPLSELIDRLADDMAAAWAAGTGRPTESYLDLQPELHDNPDAALELLAEELALRAEHGRPATADELTARFPQWRPQVEALLVCQRLLGPQLLPPRFPEPGEELGEFVLGAELGRGGHGRVYRAAQPALAGRPVVLKVSPDAGEEHLSLARLQHTNIVPLYSAHEFPDRRLRAICLPDFGGRTLADLQTELSQKESPTGRDLRAALGPAADGPARGYLARASLADAACWIAAGLADALRYAHDRGILHLDVKPSNVLVAADGVPMLLDFHLAHGPLAAGQPAPDWLGGTPAYMAPEHRAALEAVRTGRPIATAVGPPADLYSLGVMLRGFLTATRYPVSRGLSDLLDRATADRVEDRYAHAADLAADLRRHLADLPLKGVGNRSVGEAWAKWRRRRPYALPLALTLAAFLCGAGGLALSSARMVERATGALADGRTHLANLRPAEAAEAFRAAEALVEGVPFQGRLRAEVRAARRSADHAAAADRLHAFAEKLRFVAVADALTPEQVRLLDAECRAVWEKREQLAAEFGPDNPDLIDIGLIGAALHARATDPTSRLPLNTDTTADPVRAGRSLLAAGDVGRAEAAFAAALRHDPGSFWAHYYHGVAFLRLNRPADALAAFTACVALEPRAAWCRFNRALALAALDRPADAVADLDAALAIDPDLWAAHWERAAAHLKLGRPDAALADLGRAAGAPRAETLYRTAVVQLARGDRPAAATALRDCLAIDARHAEAARLLQQLDRK